MSATMLWCVLVLGILASAAHINNHDSNVIVDQENETTILNGNGIFISSKNRKIVVEEVDKNGNSVVKELELPDFDESEEIQEDKRRREQQEKAYQTESLNGIDNQDIYGCGDRRGNRRRKCLRRQKKLLRKRYKNWKELIRRIIKDLDGKIKKTLAKDSEKESTTKNLNFMTGFSPRNVMRKKE